MPGPRSYGAKVRYRPSSDVGNVRFPILTFVIPEFRAAEYPGPSRSALDAANPRCGRRETTKITKHTKMRRYPLVNLVSLVVPLEDVCGVCRVEVFAAGSLIGALCERLSGMTKMRGCSTSVIHP